jgi:hypothetical protein
MLGRQVVSPEKCFDHFGSTMRHAVSREDHSKSFQIVSGFFLQRLCNA